jgi:hypothetical protein
LRAGLHACLLGSLDIVASSGQKPGNGLAQPPIGNLVRPDRAEDRVLVVRAREADQFGQGVSNWREDSSRIVPVAAGGPASLHAGWGGMKRETMQ